MKAVIQIGVKDLDETKALLRGHFGRELINVAKNYTMCVSFSAPYGEEWLPLKTGSAFAVKTPNNLFLVTANHIYQEYLEFSGKYKNARFQIGSLEFKLRERLIASNARSDIATFSLLEDELLIQGKVPISSWPPIDPVADQGIMFSGFPGKERTRLTANAHSAGMFIATGRVYSVTSEQIKTTFEHDLLVDVMGDGKLPGHGYDVGGMSGGPLLTLIERGSILSWRLGGIISEGFPEADLVIARSATGITEFGSVR